MDSRNVAQRDQTAACEPGEPQAIDFVRFCYRRRHVGWPELYDEMCAVAGRGLYHGYGSDELSGLGIGFSLFEMPALAALVQRVVAEDVTRRRLSIQAVRSAAGDSSTAADATAGQTTATSRPAEAEPAPAAAAVVPVSSRPAEPDSPEPYRRLVAVASGA